MIALKTLFDTNILIDALTGQPDVRSKALAEIAAANAPAISVITSFEVLAGVVTWDQAAALALIDRFAQIEIDADIALYAATVSRERHLPMADAFIVATAQATGRTLISRDAKLANEADDPPVIVPYVIDGG
jgi:predicted nucleic acid-binding protein